MSKYNVIFCVEAGEIFVMLGDEKHYPDPIFYKNSMLQIHNTLEEKNWLQKEYDKLLKVHAELVIEMAEGKVDQTALYFLECLEESGLKLVFI